MKQLIMLFATVFCTVNLSFAQAYLSPTPVDQGSHEVSNSISGTWKIEKYNDAGQAYTIMADPNKKGHVNIIHGFGTMRPAIISKINNNLFLSLSEVGGPEQPEGFYIFLLEMKSETNIRLVPLKYDLKLPNNQTLTQFLQRPDMDLESILQPQAINLTNRHFVLKRPLDTTGRKINIVSKK